MGKVQPNGFFFLFGMEAAGSACRSACIYCNGGEAYEIPQYGKPVLHESGGVCRDRAAASGDGRVRGAGFGSRACAEARSAGRAGCISSGNSGTGGRAARAPAQPEIAAASEAPAEQETEAEPVDPPLVFSADEADAIGIVGACSYQPDKQALLTRPSALSLSDDGPAVLIVHTHSSEAYTMEAGFEYPESDALRTLDERYSVIRVGDEIADILTEAGISVLHDTQPNDYPNYNGAYERMRQTIEGYLAEYPSIQMVLDIHRDAAEDADGNPVALTAEADGEACAELMLVVGTDEGGLSHPDWQENLANALKIQTLLNRSAPGLCRNLNLRTERFNQHETPGSLLVEVGASGNTLAEALRSARILGQALAVFLRGQMHDDTD